MINNLGSGLKWRPTRRTLQHQIQCCEWLLLTVMAMKTLKGRRAPRCDELQFRAKMTVRGAVLGFTKFTQLHVVTS